MPTKNTVLVGQLIVKKKRTASHRNYINSLIGEIRLAMSGRGGELPKIYLEKEMADVDKISIEGENNWCDRLNSDIPNRHPQITVQHGSNKTELYVPVKNGGTFTPSPVVEIIASLSMIVLCVALLYLYLCQ